MNILIVGGANGIGRLATRRLVAGGDRVVVADRDVAALEALASAHGDVVTVAMDMVVRQSVASALRTVADTVGALDAVVISAGVHHTYPIEFVPDQLADARRRGRARATAPVGAKSLESTATRRPRRR
ncbi:MAG: SDR family NAD(P)-dependent oxidoreductase [Acidobacteria bacterium]|nr:SDR family NAD(P)-dependent oxidoreductase [Acidobacteriota bacterium]